MGMGDEGFTPPLRGEGGYGTGRLGVEVRFDEGQGLGEAFVDFGVFDSQNFEA